MKPQAVIFDFNGTLFQDSQYHIKAWKNISKEMTNFNYTDEEIESICIGLPNDKTIDLLAKGTLQYEERLVWSKRKEEIYRELVKNDSCAKLVDGAIKLFEQLKLQNIPFTIASASIIENIEFFFKHFGLGNWFELDQVIYDVGTYQSKTPMYKKACESLNVAPENTLAFEDSYSGYASAVESGIKSIIIISDPKRKDEFLHSPCVIQIIHDFTEFTIE